MADPTPLEQAVVALADHRLVRTADIGFLHGCAARIRNGISLNALSAGRSYRLLDTYRSELVAAGLLYEQIPPPDGHSLEAVEATVEKIGRSQVWVADGWMWLKSPYAAYEIVKSRILTAEWQKARKCYRLPATPAAALAVAGALGAYGIDADDEATALVRQGHVLAGVQAKRSATDLPPIPNSRTEAWTHQLQAFWFCRELPGSILDMEMGTGKSKVVVDLLGDDAGLESAMIVCPERVVGVWPKQFGIHSGRDWHIIDPRKQNRRGEWELLPIKERVDLYDEALHACGCGLPHVLMTNYAASAHEPFKSWSKRQHINFIAYDEAHRIRSHTGVWSKWAELMHARTDRRLGGTGTLQAQTPLDVFGPFRAVEPGVFGTTFTGFKNRYAVFGGYDNRTFQKMKAENEDEFAERISSITYHAGEEVLDLPEMLPEIEVVGRLSARARKVYRDLEEDMYAEVRRLHENGVDVFDEASVDNVLVRILRCQQITGGALPLDSGHIEEIDTAKADLLADELEDIAPHEPVIVFARFHHDLDKIRQVAEAADGGRGRAYGELSGRRSDALAADATLADGVQIAGVQIQAGGTGIDFTKSAFGIYYSVGHSLADYLQSRKRLHRPGQLRSTRFRHLVLENTIDQEVYAALAARKKVTDHIASKVLGLQAGRRG